MTGTPGTHGGWLTVPNGICFVRLLACPLLPWLAWAELPYWFLGLAVALLLTDWLDGKLAWLLDQRTTFGARLDSVSDAVFYLCLLAGVILLEGELLRQEAVWVGLAVGGYAVSVAAGLIKFRRLPSYHNRLAKVSWLLVAVALVAVFLDIDGAVWALRVALVAVFLTNVEATAITLVLPRWRADVPTVYHAARLRRASA